MPLHNMLLERWHPGRFIRRFILAAWTLLLCIGVTASAALASAPSTKGESGAQTECSTGGDVIPSPNVASGTNTFNDIEAISADDIWAVGSYTNAGGVYQSLIQHWDGRRWSIIPSYVSQGHNLLEGVAAASANDVWAVGQYGVLPGDQVLIMHWDGVRWSVIPTTGTGISRLHSVSVVSANEVWAVGVTRGQGINSDRSLVMRWNGTQWSVIQSPNVQGHSNWLTDVDAASSEDVWAVGRHIYYDPKTNIYLDRILAMHWNGLAWSIVPTPQGNYLLDVTAISDNDVWAVGARGVPMTLHWDGAQWSEVPNGLREGSYLYGIDAASSSEVWAVGSSLVYGNPNGAPLMIRWDGMQWSRVPGADPSMTGGLNDVVALSSSDVRAVGSYSHPYIRAGVTLVQQWDGTQALVAPSPNVQQGGNYLSDVEVISPTDIWAVGHYTNPGARPRTLTLHWNGESWRAIPSPNGFDGPPAYYGNQLTSVDAVSSNDVWAVGFVGDGSSYSDPLILHWDGTRWSVPSNYTADPSLNSQSQQVLSTVTAISTNDVWAAGTYYLSPGESRAIFYRWNGMRWNYVFITAPTGSEISLNGIWGISANDIWAVGSSNGRTLTMHYDGVSWSTIPSPNVGSERNILRGVKALSSNDVWAVGYYGRPGTGQALILRWDGARWAIVPGASVGTDSFLFDVEPVSPNNVWAVGNYLDGTQKALVEHWDGSSWRLVPSPAPGTGASFLFGIEGVSATRLWAVGNYDQGTERWTLTEQVIPPNFSDVPIGSTFEPFVNCLVCRGIISGYADGTFRPNNNVTRGQLSKIVSNSANYTEDPGPQIFEDMPPGSTFYEWVQRLALRGHIGGYPCGGAGEPCVSGKPYFRPNNNATRAQISKIVSNARGYNEPAGAQIFEDVLPTHSFYEWIQRLAQHGAMGGYECGGAGEPCGAERRPYFRPNNNATRGQTSKIVANTFFPQCAP